MYARLKSWKGWEDFLGSSYTTFKNDHNLKTYRSYDEAKTWAHTLKLTSSKEWIQWQKKNERPDDIPSKPREVYTRLQTWQGWEDFLGSNYVSRVDAVKAAKAKKRLKRNNPQQQQQQQQRSTKRRRRTKQARRRRGAARASSTAVAPSSNCLPFEHALFVGSRAIVTAQQQQRHRLRLLSWMPQQRLD